MHKFYICKNFHLFYWQSHEFHNSMQFRRRKSPSTSKLAPCDCNWREPRLWSRLLGKTLWLQSEGDSAEQLDSRDILNNAIVSDIYIRISKIALMIDHVTDNHACRLCGGEGSKNPQPGSRVHHHGGHWHASWLFSPAFPSNYLQI